MACLTGAAVVTHRDEQNLHDVRDAVAHLYTKVSEETLLHADGLEPLRMKLLEEASTITTVAFYPSEKTSRLLQLRRLLFRTTW